MTVLAKIRDLHRLAKLGLAALGGAEHHKRLSASANNLSKALASKTNIAAIFGNPNLQQELHDFNAQYFNAQSAVNESSIQNVQQHKTLTRLFEAAKIQLQAEAGDALKAYQNAISKEDKLAFIDDAFTKYNRAYLLHQSLMELFYKQGTVETNAASLWEAGAIKEADNYGKIFDTLSKLRTGVQKATQLSTRMNSKTFTDKCIVSSYQSQLSGYSGVALQSTSPTQAVLAETDEAYSHNTGGARTKV